MSDAFSQEHRDGMNSIKALQFFIEHNMTVDTLIITHRILNVLKYSLPSKRVTILMQAIGASFCHIPENFDKKYPVNYTP